MHQLLRSSAANLHGVARPRRSTGRVRLLAASVHMLSLLRVIHSTSRLGVAAAHAPAHVHSVEWDIRHRLGSKTRYAYRLPIAGSPFIYDLPDPQGYEPVHLWLLSRHGTRWPTGDRLRQIASLTELFKDATNTEELPWLREWQSPLHKHPYASGELHSIGEDELWALATRLRHRFPSLVADPYFPKRYPVVSTSVARAAASASAFTLGFFPASAINPADQLATTGASAATQRQQQQQQQRQGASPAGQQQQQQQQGGGLFAGAITRLRHMLAPFAYRDGSLADEAASGGSSSGSNHATKRPQAVAMSMLPKHRDPLLRFFDCCPAYAQHEEYTEQWLAAWKRGNWSTLVPKLEKRLGLSRAMDPCEVESVWQLCLMEAGLHEETSKACALFSPQEAALLEWLDDVDMFESHGYGSEINYKIASPLLHDLHSTLKAAAQEEPPAVRARLLFAHLETVLPLATLMGLFQVAASRVAGVQGEGVESLQQMQDAINAIDPVKAQTLMSSVDAVEDLALRMRTAHVGREVGQEDGSSSDGTGGSNSSSSSSSGAGRGLQGDDDKTCCYKGMARGVPEEPRPPRGWRPMVPLTDDDRLWKGARIGPFGANMAVVLYRRSGGPASVSSHRVRLLYNEQAVAVPGCTPVPVSDARGDSHEVDCELEEFLQVMAARADPAIMRSMCGASPEPSDYAD